MTTFSGSDIRLVVRCSSWAWLSEYRSTISVPYTPVSPIPVHPPRLTLSPVDDGTAAINCVLRHPHPTLLAPAPRSPTRVQVENPKPQRPSPKKPRLDKAKLELTEPPPPITEQGYPVRVVGRVARHYESKQIYADTIGVFPAFPAVRCSCTATDPCPSSLDEIAHLERVIELHKTKYSLAVPFLPPPKSTSRIPPLDPLTDPDASVFSNKSALSPSTASYTLPPPPLPIPLQSRNRPSSVPTHLHSAYHDHTHVPSSPTASSIASSTPSSPCKPTSPVKAHEASPPVNSMQSVDMSTTFRYKANPNYDIPRVYIRAISLGIRFEYMSSITWTMRRRHIP